jgi:hypothetical protein
VNRYSQDGLLVFDTARSGWACNRWYPLPIPDGIQADACTDGQHVLPTWRKDSTHWLVRSPIPPLPEVKTVAELDDELVAQYRRCARSGEGMKPPNNGAKIALLLQRFDNGHTLSDVDLALLHDGMRFLVSFNQEMGFQTETSYYQSTMDQAWRYIQARKEKP